MRIENNCKKAVFYDFMKNYSKNSQAKKNFENVVLLTKEYFLFINKRMLTMLRSRIPPGLDFNSSTNFVVRRPKLFSDLESGLKMIGLKSRY